MYIKENLTHFEEDPKKGEHRLSRLFVDCRNGFLAQLAPTLGAMPKNPACRQKQHQ